MALIFASTYTITALSTVTSGRALPFPLYLWSHKIAHSGSESSKGAWRGGQSITMFWFVGNVLKEWREKKMKAAMKKKEEGFSMQMRCSSGPYCLLGTELSEILLTHSSWGTHSKCCLNIKEEDFKLGFTFSSFKFWAVKHNQINLLWNVSEVIVIWLLLKIHSIATIRLSCRFLFPMEKEWIQVAFDLIRIRDWKHCTYFPKEQYICFQPRKPGNSLLGLTWITAYQTFTQVASPLFLLTDSFMGFQLYSISRIMNNFVTSLLLTPIFAVEA